MSFFEIVSVGSNITLTITDGGGVLTVPTLTLLNTAGVITLPTTAGTLDSTTSAHWDWTGVPQNAYEGQFAGEENGVPFAFSRPLILGALAPATGSGITTFTDVDVAVTRPVVGAVTGSSIFTAGATEAVHVGAAGISPVTGLAVDLTQFATLMAITPYAPALPTDFVATDWLTRSDGATFARSVSTLPLPGKYYVTLKLTVGTETLLRVCDEYLLVR